MSTVDRKAGTPETKAVRRNVGFHGAGNRIRIGAMTRGVWVSLGMLMICLILVSSPWPEEPGEHSSATREANSEPRLKAAVRCHGEYVSAIAVAADGRTVAAVSPNGTAVIWDLDTGAARDLPTDQLAQPTPRTLSYSADGTRLAALTFANEVIVWDMPAGETRRVFQIDGDFSRSLCFTGAGKTLWTTGRGRSLQLSDATAGSTLATIPVRGDRTTALDLSRDERWLAIGDRDGLIAVVDSRTGAERCVLRDRGSAVMQVAFSPDGATLASASITSHDIVLWDLASSRERARFHSEGAWATCMSFSRDGQTLATADSTGVIRIWNVADAREILRVCGPKAWVWAVGFSPDGRTLYSGGVDSMLRAWDIADVAGQ